MNTIYLIETDPINKEYYQDVHCGWVNTSNTISESRIYKSYEDAQKDIEYIVTGDFDSSKTLYLSIVKFITKN